MNVLRTFGTFSVYLVHFSGFGIMYQEKSGNPVLDKKKAKASQSATFREFASHL
jgi:hypothetical protein